MFSQLEYSSTKHLASRTILGQNIQPVGIFQAQHIQSAGIVQDKMFSQLEYSRTKYSANRNIPVQNMQPVGIFQYTPDLFAGACDVVQYRAVQVVLVAPRAVVAPALPNIRSMEICQYKLLSQ
jgi:hypothetical protein